ncbi:hypothetical protein [Methanolobus halotolerans]|uniref:Uncharacterized protein n=1 Tax=Methanolobus halotolerans TaxID=2052935 RepID=A0A4E0R0G2_9EURY|nr:hypothetical protein [Methanolobus halotolerans]TGC09806.1 hypothetical protein CUN85_05490 [Methanolobus halotolerans]
MALENLNQKKDILSFCDVRIEQLTNDRKKVLTQCEDEFKYEINSKFAAKIEEINHIKNIVNDGKLDDHSKYDFDKIE